MSSFDPKLSSRGAVGSQIIGDQPLGGEGILFQELAHQFQRGVLVSLGLDQHIEDFTSASTARQKVDHSAVDFPIDLVEVPSL